MGRLILMRLAEVAPMMVALGPVAGATCVLAACLADLRAAVRA
ncbi:MAG TPA: hypothetical protein VEW04_12085 [Allosphingosinicella sp.]|nr:hypothetical protein [Allosphingosinicella sp.]